MEESKKIPLAVITGPTASGKTDLAMEIARYWRDTNGIQSEILCCDSMLVFKGLNIGTDKPSNELLQEFPHHGLNVISADQTFSAGEYVEFAQEVIQKIYDRGNRILVVGGTALYLRTLTKGILKLPEMDEDKIEEFRTKLKEIAEKEGSCKSLYDRLCKIDPEAYQTIHPNDLYRIVRALEVYEFTGRTLRQFQKEHQFQEQPYNTQIIAIDWPRETLYQRINDRIERMLANGLEEEIDQILKTGTDQDARSLQGLAYKFLIHYKNGQISKEEAIEKTKQESRRFAKRQLTWFRAMDELQWIPSDQSKEKIRDQAVDVFQKLYE